MYHYYVLYEHLTGTFWLKSVLQIFASLPEGRHRHLGLDPSEWTWRWVQRKLPYQQLWIFTRRRAHIHCRQPRPNAEEAWVRTCRHLEQWWPEDNSSGPAKSGECTHLHFKRFQLCSTEQMALIWSDSVGADGTLYCVSQKARNICVAIRATFLQ